MFESRISGGATSKLLGREKPHAKTVAWSYDVEGHAKKVLWEIFWTGEKKDGAAIQSSKSLPAWSPFEERGAQPVGQLPKALPQIVPKRLYLARIGRPDILWSVNKLARSVTKCTHMWQTTSKADFSRVTRPNIVDGVHFKIQILLETLLNKNQPPEESYVLCRTFVPISWMCKKQTPVSHNPTESEIISLDAGLRVDGIPPRDYGMWWWKCYIPPKRGYRQPW